MNTLLAQATTPDAAAAAAASPDAWAQIRHLCNTSIEIFSRGDTLAKPDELIGHLAQLGSVWAIVFVIGGMLCLLNGYKFYKVATVLLVVMIGSLFGYWIGIEMQGPPFVVAGCIGVLLAVLAFPMMKFAVAVLGGLSGAFIGANLWAGIGRAMDSTAQKQLLDYEAALQATTAAGETAPVNPADGWLAKAAEVMPADMYWIGALAGLVVCGIAAFVLFKLSIHLFTSVTGATIAVFGVIALLLSVDTFSETVRTELSSNALVIPLLVFVPAAIGFVLQEMSSGAFGGGGDGKPATA